MSTVTRLHAIKTNHAHRWTDDELKQLMKMWMEGADLEAIAHVFSVSTFAVNKKVLQLRQNGIPLPRRSPGHRAGRFNTLWTQEEIEYVIRRRNEDATYEAIATELGRTYQGINGLVTRLHQEGVPVKMIGKGKRKLWNAAKLREAILGRGLID